VTLFLFHVIIFTLSHIFQYVSNFLSLQHWIHLEMYPDILISQLYMRVEPNDSSYMPSMVVISGGDNIHNLKEIKTVNIGSNEKLVLLLQDMTEVLY